MLKRKIFLIPTVVFFLFSSLAWGAEEEVSSKFSTNIIFTVSPGTPKYIIFPYGDTDGLKVTLIPGGNTALCEETSSPQAAIRGGTATYISWTKGSVTATTTDTYFGANTGFRFTATGGDITVELVRSPQ